MIECVKHFETQPLLTNKCVGQSAKRWTSDLDIRAHRLPQEKYVISESYGYMLLVLAQIRYVYFVAIIITRLKW